MKIWIRLSVTSLNITDRSKQILKELTDHQNNLFREMYMAVVEQYLKQKHEEVEKNFKCPECGCTNVTLYISWCSYYGECPPSDHTCGDQEDNNYANPKQSNPADIQHCEYKDSPLEVELLHYLEAPNVPTSESISKYDLFFRCANEECMKLTGDEL